MKQQGLKRRECQLIADQHSETSLIALYIGARESFRNELTSIRSGSRVTAVLADCGFASHILNLQYLYGRSNITL